MLPVLDFSASASGGNSTSTSTIARSSTTSQPTAMRPLTVSSSPRPSSALSNTTVLATDNESPNTIAPPSGQPHQSAIAAPSAVATVICTIAPGNAILRTDNRSPSEKCKPTPNISNITPISASWRAISTSATNPGVAGPIITPASRYPTRAGILSRAAMKPSTSARPKPAAMVAIRLTECGIDKDDGDDEESAEHSRLGTTRRIR